MNGMSIQTWDEWFLVHPMGSHGNPNRGTRYAMHQNPHGKAKLKTVIYLQRTHIVVCIYNMYLCMHIYICIYMHTHTLRMLNATQTRRPIIIASAIEGDSNSYHGCHGCFQTKPVSSSIRSCT